ncbi:MAG: hypothetical protein V1688_03215 [bacterium]
MSGIAAKDTGNKGVLKCGDACYHDPLCDCGKYDEFCDESRDCDEEEICGGLDSDVPF